MNQLTDERLVEVVQAIRSEVPEDHYTLGYFSEAIKNNNLQDLFTEEQMTLLGRCELTYQECDEEDVECDEGIYYDVRYSFPWSSGSSTESQEDLDNMLKDEITRTIKRVIEHKNNYECPHCGKEFDDAIDFADHEAVCGNENW